MNERVNAPSVLVRSQSEQVQSQRHMLQTDAGVLTYVYITTQNATCTVGNSTPPSHVGVEILPVIDRERPGTNTG